MGEIRPFPDFCTKVDYTHTCRSRWRTLVGYETLAMMRKGQVKGVGGSDIVAQAAFVDALFGVAA
jgi:hypothetical protein